MRGLRAAEARLLVSPPEAALQAPEAVITGRIAGRGYGEARHRVTIEVEEVLRGRIEWG